MKRLRLVFYLMVILSFTSCGESDKVEERDWEWGSDSKERLLEVIAHRGASGYELENSLAAFKEAVKLGSDYVELDIWRTIDDSIVVHHDRDTERLTGVKYIIPQSTYAELRSLKLSNGECIPTLREVLSMLPDTIGVFVEIKCCWESGAAGEVFPFLTNILEQSGFQDRATINSFNAANVDDVDQNVPEIPFYLFSYVKEEPIIIIDRAVDRKCDGVNLSYLLVNEELVALAEKHNLKVYVWGVNTAEIARQMLFLNVDGITTDYPDIIIDAVTR